MTEDEDRPIGTNEAAKILGRSPRSVQRAANTGAIPILRRHSGGLLFSQKTIEEIASSEQAETPAP